MGFKCELTRETKAIFRRIILATEVRSISSATMVVIWVFEYFCSYLYIDSDAIIDYKNICKHINVTDSERSIISIIQGIRNSVVHSPFKLKKLYKQYTNLLNSITMKDYGNFFEVFESDKYEILDLFKKCVRFCMLYYEEEIESLKAELENTVDNTISSELPDIDNMY